MWAGAAVESVQIAFLFKENIPVVLLSGAVSFVFLLFL